MVSEEKVKMKVKVMIGGLLVGAAMKAAFAATVTLAPPAGVTTNVLQFFTGDTAVEIAGPGTVSLNPANSHTGGTTLSGGTLLLNGTVDGVFSPVGVGMFSVTGGKLLGSGTFAHDISATGAFSIDAPNGWVWTGDNAFSAAATVTNGTLEIGGGTTACSNGLSIADGATVSVTGGTLGFSTASASGTGTIAINGGTLKNVSTASTGDNNYFDWLPASVSVSIGAEGAVFKGGGTTTFYAQIRSLLASSVEPGESSAGVTFDGGNWAYYATMTHAGPTIIKNGAALFLSGSGYIPSSSAVTVGSGSRLRLGYSDRTVSSLTLEEGAILGFASDTHILTVSGTVTFPKEAKIALYANNNPKTAYKNDDGTYAVLKVPVAYADALRAVLWSCASTTSGKSYTFTVATSGEWATLSMTIASMNGTIGGSQGSNTSLTIAENESVYRSKTIYIGSGSLTMNGGYLESPNENLLSYGTGGAGTITLNGGLLDVRLVSLSSGPDMRVDLYLNEGATLRARQMVVDEVNTVEHAFHFNGGTLQPVAFASGDNYRYFPRFQSAYVGEKGVVIDLSAWAHDGRTGWYRFSCMAPFDHDPACVGADGGITVRGIPGETTVFHFGSGFAGASFNGEVVAEAGGNIMAVRTAFSGKTVTMLPGSLFRTYSNTMNANVQTLTIGAANATDAVTLQMSNAATVPALVAETLTVLSPVEFSTYLGRDWDCETGLSSGVYTAIVYRTASAAIDTSLFRASANDAQFSLTAETAALTEGTYAGYTALVFNVSVNNLTLTNNDAMTISSAADYNKIHVGDFGIVGTPTLTLADGADVHAGNFHLAYQPADGANASSGRHTVTYVQNGGSLTVDAIYAMYRGSNSQDGRAHAVITLNGGSFDVLGDVMLGYNRTRAGYVVRLNINDGAMTVGGEMLLTRFPHTGSATAPQGVLTMNGGTLSVANDIDLSCCVNSSGYSVDGGIFLRGGVLSARNIKQSSAGCTVQRLVFDGGVYAPNAAATNQTLTGLAKAHVSTNGAIVSTAKMPADGTYTIAQDLLKDPGLNGAADGGFTKRGTGTLALTGANTFTGPTRVEGGKLAVSSADAISDDVTVADGAALDLGGSSVTLGTVAASGVIENGSLSVTGLLVTAGDSFLNVDGDLTLSGVEVDFAGGDAGWRPLAAVSGTVAVPPMLKARNASNFKRCKTSVLDGVVYVCPTKTGFVFSVK